MKKPVITALCCLLSLGTATAARSRGNADEASR